MGHKQRAYDSDDGESDGDIDDFYEKNHGLSGLCQLEIRFRVSHGRAKTKVKCLHNNSNSLEIVASQMTSIALFKKMENHEHTGLINVNGCTASKNEHNGASISTIYH